MGYKVVKDVIHKGEEKTLDNREYDNYQGGKHRYRLLDDDMEVYFYIESDCNPSEGYEDEIFAPLDRFECMYGCCHLEFKDSDGKYKAV